MGLALNIFLSVGVLVSIYLGNILKELAEDVPVPILPKDAYWGPGAPVPDDTTVYDFKIYVPKEVLTDLNERLDRYLKKNVTPPLENVGFKYGFNSKYLKSIVKYWRTEYKWDSTEAYINKHKHYTTQVNGLKIHFVRYTPSNTNGKKVLPLLMLHGWPSSVLEFYDLIPILTNPENDANFTFDLIIPSMPGLAFSEGSSKPSFGTAEIGVVLNNLMERLGFEKYYVHGGDWGAVTARNMGVLYPDRVLGVHSTLCFGLKTSTLLSLFLGTYYPPLVVDAEHQHLMYPLWENIKFYIEESGYFHQQATKPDTIGALLEDSPAGLAAWFLEKYSSGGNRSNVFLDDGGLTKHYKSDALIDNIMIYWVMNSATTGARIYAEGLALQGIKFAQMTLNVPAACARFPNEIIYFSDTLLRLQYPQLVHTSDQLEGGHFSALEKPKELAIDILTAIGKMDKLSEQ